jgi:hypothetical protein
MQVSALRRAGSARVHLDVYNVKINGESRLDNVTTNGVRRCKSVAIRTRIGVEMGSVDLGSLGDLLSAFGDIFSGFGGLSSFSAE